ncbi:unnamed protein product [Closterium sp. NIES-54]
MRRCSGSGVLVPLSADKLSARAIPCVFLGFSHDAPGWQFYHPTSRCVLLSQDVTFEGAEPAGAEPGGAESKGAGSWAESEGEESGGAEPGGTLSPGGHPGALSRREPLSPVQLCEWFARRTRFRSGAAEAGGAARVGAGGAARVGAGGTGAGAAGGTGAACPGGARTRGTRVAGAGGAAGVGARDLGAGAAGGTGVAGPGGACPRGNGAARAGGAAGVGAGGPEAGGTGAGGAGPVLCLPSSIGLTPPLPDQSQPPLQPASPLLAPSPYTEQTGGLAERCEPVSLLSSLVRTVLSGRRVPRQRRPPVPGTHHMALRPSCVPQRVPLPSPPASSLADRLDHESDLVSAASPTVPRLLATVVTDHSFESALRLP